MGTLASVHKFLCLPDGLGARLAPLKYLLLIPLFLGCLHSPAFGYGSDGHRIVGAIADEKLEGTAAGIKIAELLDGIKLTEAAVLADQIRRWDKDGPDSAHTFHLDGHPLIEKQLAAFWKANPPADKPRSMDDSDKKPEHSWFHYTDVPIFQAAKYGDGKTGRSQWDIVRMISFCVRVLQGEESEQNPRAITKPVAIILLAHYLGDIHQPLHVGAEFFDAAGKPCDPDRPAAAGEKPAVFYETMGGNSLLLTLKTPPPPGEAGRRARLHSYWDVRTVKTAWTILEEEGKKQSPDPGNDPKPSEILKYLATREPLNWRLDEKIPLSGYAEAWANEILPLAKEAHDRLDFENMICKEEDKGSLVATGLAVEARSPDGKSYELWSGEVVKDNLHKAGWRLADLLSKVVL